MNVWMWIGIVVLALAALVLGVRNKLRRDAITQNGARVGSAMLAQHVPPGAAQARFMIVRGEPAFQESEAFEHGGQRFRILSYGRLDDRSTVLRRFLDVVCAVEQSMPGGAVPAH